MKQTVVPNPAAGFVQPPPEIAKALIWTEYKTQNPIEIDKAEPQAVKEIILGTTTVKKAAKRVKAGVRARRPNMPMETKPPTASTKPKPAQPRTPFDIEKALTAAMRSPDEVYETVPEDWRDEFKEELAKTIQLLP